MTIDTTIQGIPLIVKTQASLLSPNGIDPGTLCLLVNVRFDIDDKVLDLGCGGGFCQCIAGVRVLLQSIGEESAGNGL